MISFNQPYISGAEYSYIQNAVESLKISGNGDYTKKCHEFFKERYGFKHCLLTTSCTDAIEMASLLIEVENGDEIILPSYTFVSTANPFVLRGAKLKFGDSQPSHPNISLKEIKRLYSHKTKAVVVVHYAGMASELREIQKFCNEKNIFLIEDAAQAIDNQFEDQYLGTFGDLACFSFHETKNIICGEGGLLVVNNEQMINRAEILWEKGTNRAAFFRGEINKYGWVDVGSSFLASDLNAAFLFAQLENIDDILNQRKKVWNNYHKAFQEIANKVELPVLPQGTKNNAHIYYLCCKSIEERSKLIQFLKENGVYAVFHYLSLHKSSFIEKTDPIAFQSELPECERYSNCLVRLPLYAGMKQEDNEKVIEKVLAFFNDEIV